MESRPVSPRYATIPPWPAFALVALLALTLACEPPNWKSPPWMDIQEGPQADADSTSADGGAEDAGPKVAPSNGACSEHVLQCPLGQGCVNTSCGGCTKAGDCRALQGCVAGKCGMCAKDTQCESGKQCLYGFCLRTPIRQWDLLVTAEDWQKLLASTTADTFVPCSLRVGEVTYADGCAVRMLGESLTDGGPAPAKRSLRIRFDDGADHPGFSRKINLRAEYGDPSYLRSFLASWLFEHASKVPTPRVRFRRLLLNGEDLGVYTEVERIGQAFRRRRDRDPLAPLYESDPPAELEAKGAGALLKLPQPHLYKLAYQKHSEPAADYADLIALIDKTIWPDYSGGAGANKISGVFDVARLVDYLAVMAVIGNASHVGDNFYLSLQKVSGTPRWELYPWDLDRSFGCQWQSGDASHACTDVNNNAPWSAGAGIAGQVVAYPTAAPVNALIAAAMADDKVRGLVQAKACAILKSSTWLKDLPALIEAVQSQLAVDVATDAHDRNLTAKVFQLEVQRVRLWTGQRASALNAALGCGS